MKELFLERMRKSPVIATLKSLDELETALECECEIVFLLCGDIFNLKSIVEKLKAKGKMIFIHVDLVDGFSKDATALKYIHEEIKPDGIISTKNSLLKCAKQLGLLTVQRLFIIDSLSIDTTVKASASIAPDAVEIMPGIMPRITKKLCNQLDVPIIVGGLIDDENDITCAIESGAKGVSTSKSELWGGHFNG